MKEERKKLVFELGSKLIRVIAEFGLEHTEEIMAGLIGQDRKEEIRPRRRRCKPSRRSDSEIKLKTE